MTSQPGRARRIGRGLTTMLAGFFPLLLLGAFVLEMASEPPREPRSPLSDDRAKPMAVAEVAFQFGRGYIGDGWQVYFTEPDASGDRSRYQGGIEAALVAAIDGARETIEIAAFELNSEPIARALQDARERGVVARVVADDAHGLDDERNPQLRELKARALPLVDDGRGGLDAQ